MWYRDATIPEKIIEFRPQHCCIVFCIFALIYSVMWFTCFVHTLFWLNPSDWFIYCHVIAFKFLVYIKAHVIFLTPATNSRRIKGLRSEIFHIFSGSCIPTNESLIFYYWHYLHWHRQFNIIKYSGYKIENEYIPEYLWTNILYSLWLSWVSASTYRDPSPTVKL